MISKRIRQGLVWLLHQTNGLTTREIAGLTERSQRTVQVGLKAAKDYLEATGNLDWLELVMSGSQARQCIHPKKVSIGKVVYCLDCGWSSHPDHWRLHTTKKAIHSDATDAAKKQQPKGAPKFKPRLKKAK